MQDLNPFKVTNSKCFNFIFIKLIKYAMMNFFSYFCLFCVSAGVNLPPTTWYYPQTERLQALKAVLGLGA